MGEGDVRSNKAAECMISYRDNVCSGKGVDCYPWQESNNYIYAESSFVLIRTVLMNILFAIIACYAITLIIIPSFYLATITMLCVAQILIGVLGYCHFWGLRIDVTLSINLVLTIGFAVDNVAHLLHAYNHAPFNDVNDRVLYAVNHAAVPVLMGDLTTAL